MIGDNMKQFKLFQVSVTVGYDSAILAEFQPPTTTICYDIHEDAEWHVNDARTTREDAILQIMCHHDKNIEVELSEPEHGQRLGSACYKHVNLVISKDDDDIFT